MPSFCKAVDLVITPSAGMEKILRELNVEGHIEVVPNGVDLKKFSNAIPLSRSEFGYTENDTLLVYAGRVAPEKNLPFLLQSFAGLIQAIPNAHLLIIGGGAQQFEEEIHTLVNSLELTQHVRLTGKISYDLLPAYLAMCDIFVTPSISEVHPLSVIEAMGAGLPVMGIDSVGVGDTVQDEITGFLATHDQAAFTAKLTRLCLDPNLRAQMSHSARKASSAFAIEHTTSLMLHQYEKLANETPSRKRNWSVRLRKILEDFWQ
jgi:glycosyltransferase involved in cell wall biosynthesis